MERVTRRLDGSLATGCAGEAGWWEVHGKVEAGSAPCPWEERGCMTPW